MAAQIIQYDPTKQPVADAVAAMRQIRDARERLKRARDVMIRFRDGDGSVASHYDLLATACAYVAGDYADANTSAKASFDEIDSCISKLTTDGSITDMLAAVDQCCAKHGV